MENKNLHNSANASPKQNPKTFSKTLWIKCAVLLALISSNAQANQRFETERDKHNLVELSAAPNASKNDIAKQRLIQKIAEKKTSELSRQVIENIDHLQNAILATPKNKKASRIRKLFSQVYKKGGLSGKENYCVAGATSAYYESVTDSLMNMVLKNILVSTEATPKKLQLDSHPNVSCPAFCAYYKAKLGSNYIDQSTKDYQAVFKNQLEPGDILMLKSSQNTSSGMHCVTFEKYDEQGDICVKSLNCEKDYSVKLSKIIAVAKIPSQYKDELITQLEEKPQLLEEMIAQDEELRAQAFLLHAIPPKENFQSYAVAEVFQQGGLQRL
ncbi:MAG: hypothetical protein IJ870_03180 [Alphaproteobacteria bacterium]|nr:hypothetical protein [Alphaproteobacteria bacterium]